MTHALARRRGGSPRAFRRRHVARSGLALLAAISALVFIAIGLAAADLGVLSPSRPVAAALERELLRADVPPELNAAYEAREFQPLWVESSGVWPFRRASLGPETGLMVTRSAPAERRRLAAILAAARDGDPGALARAEVALSLSLGRYAKTQRMPAPAARLAYLEPGLAPATEPGAVLEEAGRAPSLAGYLAAVDEVNPVYKALSEGLAAYRAQWSRLPQVAVAAGPRLGFGDRGARVEMLRHRLGLPVGGVYDEALESAVRRFQTAHGLPVTGETDATTVAALNAGAGHYEQLIAANLERARALPPVTGRRYILVNVAAGDLSFYQDGQAEGAMRVVVGTRQEQTPMMAGLITHLVFNPYWEIPADLVKTSLAPKVLQLGPRYLESRHMEALNDWGDPAGRLDPQSIDWRAVADGQQELRVRQLPGGDNMMGTVKFMLPNELGIYLHDTPDKAVFQSPQRLLSAGCVRLEHAPELAAWLLGRDRAEPIPAERNQRVDLDEPTLVYITYLTAAPRAGGVAFHPDVYGRDPALLAELAHARR